MTGLPHVHGRSAQACIAHSTFHVQFPLTFEPMPGRSLTYDGVTELEGRSVKFRLHCVAGRRNVHILVSDEGRLEVRAPWRFSRLAAKDVIEENRAWVLLGLEEAAARLRRRPTLISGCQLPYFDETLTLRLTSNAQFALFAYVKDAARRSEGEVERRSSTLHVKFHTATMSDVRELIEAWYWREAKTVLPERLRRFTSALSLFPRRVVVRAQRSCWGSCSERGTISLNWRLLLVPGELADYILVHELAHLGHLDHSGAFWRLVESVIPDYRERRHRLRQLETELPI